MALMPFTDAMAAILKGSDALPEEMVALEDAFHRVLARDVASLRTQPPEAMSAMDGYAVRATDAAVGAKLKVIGEISAGKPFDRALAPGEAARIFTGGVVPAGSDAVVIQEDTARDGDMVTVNEAAPVGKNIRPAGVDFRQGDVLLRAGTRLADRDLALAAGMNHPVVPVQRRPVVAMLATGDELVMPGVTPGPGQIVLSNGFALRALARAEGAEVIDLGIARDTLESTTAAIRRAIDLNVDVLITTGGASVGDHDLVQQSLVEAGVEMSFWKIAMRPGKPMMHGRRGPMRVIGLPGNPVSSYVCGFLFMVPLLRALSGRSEVQHVREAAVLGRDLAANDHREDYLRTRLEWQDGKLVATPVTKQDSSLLGNLAIAEGLLVRPPNAAAAKAGDRCAIIRLPT
jgi:molybdopterin molybdotransferase